jgi:hypothetical protein
LFFNKHYDIALLEISSELDLPLQLPSFGSNPNYGQEVFILARDKDSNLMARHGRVLWFEDPEKLNRNYLMLVSCDISGVITVLLFSSTVFLFHDAAYSAAFL